MANLWVNASNDPFRDYHDEQHRIICNSGIHDMGFGHPDPRSDEAMYGRHQMPMDGGITLHASPEFDFDPSGPIHKGYKITARLSDSHELGNRMDDHLSSRNYHGERFDEIHGIHPDRSLDFTEPASISVKHAHQLPEAAEHLLRNRDALRSIHEATKARRLSGSALENLAADHKPYHMTQDGFVDDRSAQEKPTWWQEEGYDEAPEDWSGL